MKPIVVVDRDAFFEHDPLNVYHTEAENLEKQRYAQGRAAQMEKEGYLVTVVKPGARVAVLWPPASLPDVGNEARPPFKPGAPMLGPLSPLLVSSPPLLIADADSGVDREKLEAEGFLVQLVKPGSRVVLL